ncbi:MAG: methyltransferase RsmF C-terminal domain-like protein [Lachnospirales bacterium]
MKEYNRDFLNSMEKLFENEYNDFLKCLDEEIKSGVRYNTLKIDDEAFSKYFDLQKVKWCNSGFYTQEEVMSKDILYAGGLYYIQEPSAMSPANFLPISPFDKVLDICASPGGKATFLGEKLKGTGVLVANDLSNKRARILARNIEKHGIENFIVLNESQDKLEKVFYKYFDKILVDAPCSGEGMFRKDTKVMSNWTVDASTSFSEIQKSILESVHNMLKDDGYIMYSTCTFNLEENEKIIEWFMSVYDCYELIPFGDDFFEKGFDGSSTYRILPHKHIGEGHFLALLHKKGSEISKEATYIKSNIDKDGYFSICKFFNKIFNFDFKEYLINKNLILYRHENSIFCIFDKLPIETNKLRTVRSGFYLCDILVKGKSEKIIPSSVFMYPFKAKDFKNFISVPYEFQKNNDFLNKFIKGDTVILDENLPFFQNVEDGYVIIAVDDFPLGYGINQGGKIKNKYNKNWI